MEEVKKINGSNSANFLNARHAHFHSLVYKMITEFGIEKVNISPALSEEYRSNIDIEIDLNNESRAFVETPQLAEADSERDAITVYLFGAIRNAMLSPVLQAKAAGEALYLLIRPYTGLHGEARDRQTAKTEGLVLDLNKPANATHIATIGQTETVALLDEKNKTYQQIKNGLTNLRAVEDLEASKVVRPRTDANYQSITNYIFATYLLATDETKKAEIATLIDHLNQLIAEQKTAHKQSQAQKTKKTSSEEKPAS
ncbi:MAG: DUF6261 family protein [Bacteroidia bacterium]|nr:DUF6261 family protein [Bacteroidia bacterium]